MPDKKIDGMANVWPLATVQACIIRLWRSAWDEFIPFLDYDTEIRQVLCSTNAIESLNARRAKQHHSTLL
jgi:putative transposase